MKLREAPVQLNIPDRFKVPCTDVCTKFDYAKHFPGLWKSLSPRQRKILENQPIISGGLITPVNAPAPPQNFVSAIPSDTVTGTEIVVNAGDDLQAALTTAAGLNVNLNHAVTLQAGATWTGNFQMPTRANGTGWITIRSSLWASLPGSGQRVSYTHAALMPKIITPNSQAALQSLDFTHGWRLLGLEVANSPNWDSEAFPQYATIHLGDAFSRPFERPVSDNGSRMIVERCFVHGAGFTERGTGLPRNHQLKGIAIGAIDVRVCDSWIEGYQGDGGQGDPAAIWVGDVCRGPVRIDNNYASANGQCVFIGSNNFYGDNTTGGATFVIPSDILILRNELPKCAKWRNGSPGSDTTSNWLAAVKPCVEVKYGRRIIIEGNLCRFSYSWPAIVLDAVAYVAYNLYGLRIQPIEDVTVRYNDCHDCLALGQIWTGANAARRIHFHDNRAVGVLASLYTYASPTDVPGLGFKVTMGGQGYDGLLEDLWLEHNTALGDRGAVVFQDVGGTSTITRVRIRNNIWGYGDEGYLARWNSNPSLIASDAALAQHITDAEIVADCSINGMIYGDPNRSPYFPYATSQAPPNNAAGEFFKPGTPAAARINWDTGILDPASPMKAGGALQASDGKDQGVDFNLLNQGLTGGVIDTTAPTVPTGLTHDTPVLATSVRLTWVPSTDNFLVSGYQVKRDGVVIGTASGPEFIDHGLTPNTAYTYAVRAFDSTIPPNFSAYTADHIVTTGVDTIATPSAPVTMRGFGTTRGIAVSDNILTPLTTSAAQRTYTGWARINGLGGSGIGMVFTRGSFPSWESSLAVESPTTMSFAVSTDGGTGFAKWIFPLPAPDVQFFFSIKYDRSNIANNPIIKINDIVQTITRFIAGTATFADVGANSFYIGNWGPTNARGWDGDIAKVAVYDFLTSDADDSSLFGGTNPMTIGAGPVLYEKLDGTLNEPDSVSSQNSTVTGTKVQNYAGAPTTTIDTLSVTSGDPTVPSAYQITAATTGTVNRVEFFVGGTLVRTDTSAPYTLFAAASFLGAGPHTIEARVYAGAGLVPSDVKTLTITEASSQINTWTVQLVWDRMPAALSYNLYMEQVLQVNIPQTPVGTDPGFGIQFSGTDVVKFFEVSGVFASGEGPKSAIRKRYKVTELSKPTGIKEISANFTTT